MPRGARLTLNDLAHKAEQSGKLHEQDEIADTVDSFVNPVSNQPSRPSLNTSFRGEGSVRVFHASFLEITHHPALI